jgi:hypothetical protein
MERRKGQKADKVIRTLGKLLTKANAVRAEAELGCCVYDPQTGSGKLICADNWTQAQCNAVKGTFSPGQTCTQVGAMSRPKARKRRVLSGPLS